MNEQKVKEYYSLLSILAVSIRAMQLSQLKNNPIFLDNILTINDYIYKKLLQFGINNIGVIEENF